MWSSCGCEAMYGGGRRLLSGHRSAAAGEFDLDQREARDGRDLELIKTNVDKLNREMEDVLGYQAQWLSAKERR